MDQWIEFLKDKWLLVIIAIVVIYLVAKLLKTVVKWGIILLIIAGLLYYGANYTEAIKDLSGKALSYAKDEVYDAMKYETDKATFTDNRDGTYTVQSPNFTVTGVNNGDKVTITFRGQSFEVKRNEIINAFIQQSKP